MIRPPALVPCPPEPAPALPCDAAVAALWAAHPNGPPPDVPEKPGSDWAAVFYAGLLEMRARSEKEGLF